MLAGPLDAAPEFPVISVEGVYRGGVLRPLAWSYASRPDGPILNLVVRAEDLPRSVRISGLSVAKPVQGGVGAPSLELLAGRGFDLGPARALVLDVRRFEDGVELALLISPLELAPDLQVFGVQDLHLEVGDATLEVTDVLASVPTGRGLAHDLILRPAAPAGAKGVRLRVGAIVLLYRGALELPVPACATGV